MQIISLLHNFIILSALIWLSKTTVTVIQMLSYRYEPSLILSFT